MLQSEDIRRQKPQKNENSEFQKLYIIWQVPEQADNLRQLRDRDLYPQVTPYRYLRQPGTSPAPDVDISTSAVAFQLFSHGRTASQVQVEVEGTSAACAPITVAGLARIKKPANAADVGCGNGSHMQGLASPILAHLGAIRPCQFHEDSFVLPLLGGWWCSKLKSQDSSRLSKSWLR